MKDELTNREYKCLVYSGNYPEVIIKALEDRGNFKQMREKGEPLFNLLNFIWKPFQYNAKVLNEINSVNIFRKYINPLVLFSNT